MQKRYLVEIRVKDWIFVPEGNSRTLDYEEVQVPEHWNALLEEFVARQKAFYQFEKRCKYAPAVRRRMESLNLSIFDCCAPVGVVIDD